MQLSLQIPVIRALILYSFTVRGVHARVVHVVWLYGRAASEGIAPWLASRIVT